MIRGRLIAAGVQLLTVWCSIGHFDLQVDQVLLGVGRHYRNGLLVVWNSKSAVQSFNSRQ